MFTAFRGLFGLATEDDWDVGLHGVSYDAVLSQAQLPIRLAGCGLRNAVRTAPAAYWASWADALPSLVSRCPSVGPMAMLQLCYLQTLDPDEPHVGPRCIVCAELAGKRCQEVGWRERPLWADIVAGQRPPVIHVESDIVGEWKHGWQYFASEYAETRELNQLLTGLAWPRLRSNAACPGKARVYSCMGRFSGTWLTVSPTTDALCFDDGELRFAVRRRLGLAVCYDGPDAHGHYRLAVSLGGGMHARHSTLIAAWKQVFMEAGGHVPHRNIERLLRTTWVSVPQWDQRRLDLVVPGLTVERGLPLFCDVTVISPISRSGQARPGASNRGGNLLEAAERNNDATYHEVVTSSIASLQCLGCEVYGRWGRQCIELVPKLACEKVKGTPQKIRRGAQLMWQRRWCGVLGVALQKSVCRMARDEGGSDLYVSQVERAPPLGHLDIV